MTYLYHYHAIAFLPDGNTLHLDGTMFAKALISTPEMFQEVREAVAAEATLPFEKMNITSLTLLNPHTP